MITEHRVHHKTPSGLIVQLPNGGYGKLTRESCGSDATADCIIKHFWPQDHLLCGPTGKNDAEGYTLMSIDLAQLSLAFRYAQNGSATASLLGTLFRMHVLSGLGMVSRAKIVATKDEGSVLRLRNNLSAVALGALPPPQQQPPVPTVEEEDGMDAALGEEGDDAPSSAPSLVMVRTLLCDVRHGKGIATCTADPRIVSRGPSPTDDLSRTDPCRSTFIGDIVSLRVLLNGVLGQAQRIAVGELFSEPLEGEEEQATSGPTLLVYVPLKEGAPAPRLGSAIDVQLTFVPSRDMLRATPFCIGSLEHSDLVGVPKSRRNWDLTSSVIMPFPWRDPRAAHAADSANDGDDDAVEQKVRRRRIEETIDQYERQGDVAPTSPQEFEKQLLATPTSSYLWVQYMAYHTAQRRIDAARTVAEKALGRIPVTEVKELVNIWVAYLNLENNFGTAESLASVFRRAVERTDDQQLIYERLADIFAATGKKQQLVELCRSMVGKFRRVPAVWERLGRALIDTGKRDQVKRVLKEMQAALPVKEQVGVVVHIAIHEYKHAAPEQGRALFEGLLAKAPKRSDVWGTYVDQELALLAHGAAEASVTHNVRHIFERIATLNLAPKVMQGFFTRWLSFEQQHGTAARIQEVKNKARSYVETRAAAATSGV